MPMVLRVHYVSDRLLDQYGTSVYTHEMVHNSDGHIYFEGKGRREGLGAELYALGLLQSADNLDKDAIVLNTLYKGDKDSPTRLHTYDPTRPLHISRSLARVCARYVRCLVHLGCYGSQCHFN